MSELAIPTTLAPSSHFRPRWHQLYRRDTLLDAALKTYAKSLFRRKTARSSSHDGQTLFDFAARSGRNLDQLHKALAAQNFVFAPAAARTYNFNGKVRTIYIYPWAERLVDSLLFDLLNRTLGAELSPRAFAYRPGGPDLDACQRGVACFINGSRDKTHVVKRDIQNYFPSVPHDKLLTQVTALVDTEDYFFTLIKQRIVFTSLDALGKRHLATQGLPFGCASACFFANLYLTPLDRQLEELPGRYFRFCDDILFLSADADVAIEAARRIDTGLATLGLAGKESHRLDTTLLKRTHNGAADSVCYLGLEFRADGIHGLAKEKLRKLRNLFGFAFRRYERRLSALTSIDARARLLVNIARGVLANGLQRVAIIDYYLRHARDERQLTALDLWLAEEIAALALGTGHRKSNFRKLSPARLRSLGLPSLRHRARLIRHGHVISPFFLWRRPTQENSGFGRGQLPGSAEPSPRPVSDGHLKLVGESGRRGQV